MSDEKLQDDLDSEVDANDPDYDDLDLENLKLPDDGFDEDDNEDDARGGDKKKWIEETLKSMSDLFKLKTALLQQEKS